MKQRFRLRPPGRSRGLQRQSTQAASPAAAQYVINCGLPSPRRLCEIETFDLKMNEGSGGGCTNFAFRVVLRNGPTDAPVTVDFTTQDKTATALSDYATNSGTVTWAPGESGTKIVNVCVVKDNVKEKDEVFLFQLSNASSNAKIVGKNPVNGTIQNDD
jgi:hypothetical protein